MKCTICRHGETAPGRVTSVLERDSSTVLVRDVPAEVCTNCGEYYLSEEVAKAIFAMAENAAERGAEIEIIRYAA